MADISKIKLPDGNTYDVKDASKSSATNWVNGSQTGSVRTINSATEDSSYTIGQSAVAEGYNTKASGLDSHAEGASTVASGDYSHAEGGNTTASNYNAHAEGTNTTASGNASHSEGGGTQAVGSFSHAEGDGTAARGEASHVEGKKYSSSFTLRNVSYTTGANGVASHSEGYDTSANQYGSHAEGYNTVANNSYTHAEGYQTLASGYYSHAENNYTVASGNYSHAEGSGSTASGEASHAEGVSTIASGSKAHAEGYQTTASGGCAHAEGAYTVASGSDSHAEGDSTIANHLAQHVFGQYNITDTSSAAATARGNYVEIVGNGTSSTRSNARTLDWSGNEVLAGKLTVGVAGTNSMDVATVGQIPNVPSWAMTSTKPTYTASEVGAVPTTRTINGYALSDDIALTKSDVGLENVDNTADADKTVNKANSLTTMRYIDGISFTGAYDVRHYGTCSTAAATTAKVVHTIETSSNFKLVAGTMLFIKFTATSTASSSISNITLNVDSTGTKVVHILKGGNSQGYVTYCSQNVFANDNMCLFVYSGDYWYMVGYHQDTTYTNKAAAEGGTTVSLVTTGEKYTWNNKIGATTPTIETDIGTSSITLTSAEKYKLTAGGGSVIFTMPTIPTKTSDLTNDSGFITGYTETDPVFTASAAHGISTTDITNWNGKQDALVSGTNIKTINNQSLLGSGDVTITETDPTVPSWAKASTKPTYTASEISGLLDFFYPVGSYYETSDTTFDPNVSWGGTWYLETAGQVHVSGSTSFFPVNSANTDTLNSDDTVGTSQGGALLSPTGDHILTAAESGIRAHGHGMSHNHSHNHASSGSSADYFLTSDETVYRRSIKPGTSTAVTNNYYGAGSLVRRQVTDTDSTGSSKTTTDNNTAGNATSAHNHGNVSTLQPYIAVNRWHRVA